MDPTIAYKEEELKEGRKERYIFYLFFIFW